MAYTGNAFAGKSGAPTSEELTAVLGQARKLWDHLLAELADAYDLMTQEWNSSSRKAGWALRLKRGERNIVYLSPGQGNFLASFALGDKAVKAAKASGLPATVVELIAGAKRYAEGTAVRLEVNGAGDVRAVKQLVGIKLEN